MNFAALSVAGMLALAANSCQPDNSGATRESQQTLNLQEQAAVTIGIPAIKNFAEKRQLKMIYELRDQATLVTYTYTLDLNNKRHKVCPTTSVGFGIPYSTQFTAPKSARYVRPIYPNGDQVASNGWHTLEADQPEPNGLYMPADASGTWVLCLHPNGKDLAPTYVEDNVVAYLFPMEAVD